MSAFALPRLLHVGAGSLESLPAALAQLGLRRPAVITDRFMVGSDDFERLQSLLSAAGSRSRVFSGSVPDPTAGSVDAAVAFVREFEHDCVIGFGGGSAIDTAKAAAVLSVLGGTIRQLKAPHSQDSGGLPIVAIPSTAGTGSEATKFTIVTDETNDEKMLCTGLAYLPSIAIVDYELTLTKPRGLTAATGIDALTHAIEAYVSRRATPFTDGMAIAAMKAIWKSQPTAYAEPSNRKAREAMMLGALQAGIAFSNASVALVHGMSRPIGAHFHVAHGLSNAMLLPAVTAWSAQAAVSRYAECARAMEIARRDDNDAGATERLIEALRKLNDELDVPTPKGYGIEEDKWTRLLPLMAEQALASGSPSNNPRIPNAATIQDLYREVWG